MQATQAAYALLPDLKFPAKPIVYPSLAALARAILRRRNGEALVLRQQKLQHDGRVRMVTEILAEDEASSRSRRIGYAWTAGRPWQALQAALEAELPNAVVPTHG